MKKAISLLMALTMLATVFTGCTSGAKPGSPGGSPAPSSAGTPAPQSPAVDSSEGVEIEFLQWFDNEMEEGYLQSICDAFYAETGIKVKLLSNPYADTKTQLQASAVAGTLPDVVALDGGWIYDYATQGLLADLGAAFDSIGFDDSTISVQTSVNGTVYAQPLVNFPCLMAVNTDLLTAAGVTQLPETWSDFVAACKKVTDPANNVYGFAMNMSTDNATCMEFFAAFAWNSGGTILTPEGKPFIANNKVLTQTTEFFKSLFDEGVTLPGMYTLTDADKVQEFVNGRVAFMPDSVAHLTNIKEQAPDLNFTYMNMPHADDYSGESFMRANNWACGISASSKHPQEAAKFIAYLLSQKVNADLAVHAGGFVVNSAAEANYTDTSDAFVAICDIYKTTTGKAEFYSLPTAEALMTVLDENLIMYIDGDYGTADEMLAQVQEAFDAAYQ